MEAIIASTASLSLDLALKRKESTLSGAKGPESTERSERNGKKKRKNSQRNREKRKKWEENNYFVEKLFLFCKIVRCIVKVGILLLSYSYSLVFNYTYRILKQKLRNYFIIRKNLGLHTSSANIFHWMQWKKFAKFSLRPNFLWKKFSFWKLFCFFHFFFCPLNIWFEYLFSGDCAKKLVISRKIPTIELKSYIFQFFTTEDVHPRCEQLPGLRPWVFGCEFVVRTLSFFCFYLFFFMNNISEPPLSYKPLDLERLLLLSLPSDFSLPSTHQGRGVRGLQSWTAWTGPGQPGLHRLWKWSFGLFLLLRLPWLPLPGLLRQARDVQKPRRSQCQLFGT